MAASWRPTAVPTARSRVPAGRSARLPTVDHAELAQPPGGGRAPRREGPGPAAGRRNDRSSCRRRPRRRRRPARCPVGEARGLAALDASLATSLDAAYADRAGEAQLVAHSPADAGGDGGALTGPAAGAGHVEEGFVEGDAFDQRVSPSEGWRAARSLTSA